MSWMYAITREEVEGGYWYGIREVYEKSSECFTTVNTIAAEGESPQEVIDALKRMLKDARLLPVFDMDKMQWCKEEGDV